MKLFKTLAAAAAVITSCIGNAIPAEAGNGWMYVGTNKVGTRSYVKVVGRRGDLVKYQNRLIKSDASGMNSHVLVMAECKNQRFKVLEGVHNGKKHQFLLT